MIFESPEGKLLADGPVRHLAAVPDHASHRPSAGSGCGIADSRGPAGARQHTPTPMGDDLYVSHPGLMTLEEQEDAEEEQTEE